MSQFTEADLPETECTVEEAAITLHQRKGGVGQEGKEAPQPPAKNKTRGSLLSIKSAATVIPKTTEEKVAAGLEIYRQFEGETDLLEWWQMWYAHTCVFAPQALHQRVFSTAGNRAGRYGLKIMPLYFFGWSHTTVTVTD